MNAILSVRGSGEVVRLSVEECCCCRILRPPPPARGIGRMDIRTQGCVEHPFWMLTLYAYSWYVERKAFAWYVTAAFLFCLGLLAKPMLVTLPFVLILLDYWPLKRSFPARLSVAASAGGSVITPGDGHRITLQDGNSSPGVRVPQPLRCRTLAWAAGSVREKIPLFLLALLSVP